MTVAGLERAIELLENRIAIMDVDIESEEIQIVKLQSRRVEARRFLEELQSERNHAALEASTSTHDTKEGEPNGR